MTSYEKFRVNALRNPKIKAEYDALTPEFDALRAKIQAKNDKRNAKKHAKQTAIKRLAKIFR